MEAIAAYEVSKQYGQTRGVERLNLQISEGAAFACVGSVKSGKTTLIRLFSGLCRPTSGECAVLGFSPYFEAERLHALVGTVLDSARLYQELSLYENLRFFAGLHGVEENDMIDRASFLLHRLDIWEGREQPVDDLPTGVVYRASAARALLHRPRVLLLDEPADGLDRETADSLESLLKELVQSEGLTLFFTSRRMAYAQRLCTEFGLLSAGALLARGDLESLRVNGGVRLRASLRLKEGDPGPAGFVQNDGLWEKEIASEEELAAVIAQAVQGGKTVYEANLIRPGLEEIYSAYLAGGIHREGGEWDEQSDSVEDALHPQPVSSGDEAGQPDSGPSSGESEPGEPGTA